MELAVDPLEATRRTSPGDEEDLLPSLLGGDGGWQVEEVAGAGWSDVLSVRSTDSYWLTGGRHFASATRLPRMEAKFAIGHQSHLPIR